MTPNETNPIPTESKCRGGLIVCKKNSKKEGVTLLDHLEKNHPELFTKEHEAMFACHAPIHTPEVGEWELELERFLPKSADELPFVRGRITAFVRSLLSKEYKRGYADGRKGKEELG